MTLNRSELKPHVQFSSEVDGRVSRCVPTRSSIRHYAAKWAFLSHTGLFFDSNQRACCTHVVQALLASPFLPPSQLPYLLSRIAASSRQTPKPNTPSNQSINNTAAPSEDVTVSDILAAAQRSAQDVVEMARVGAASAAVLPILLCSGRFSRMRAHARAATAALVLARDDQLIQELCRHVESTYFLSTKLQNMLNFILPCLCPVNLQPLVDPLLPVQPLSHTLLQPPFAIQRALIL
jgi:hypothetical protein